jgi:hypothetical protein
MTSPYTKFINFLMHRQLEHTPHGVVIADDFDSKIESNKFEAWGDSQYHLPRGCRSMRKVAFISRSTNIDQWLRSLLIDHPNKLPLS